MEQKGGVRSENFPAVTMKNAVSWDVTSRDSLKTRVPEELIASFISVTRNGELGTLAIISNRIMLRRATRRNIPEDGILQKYGVY
jgi:hypothetical protein